MKVLNKKCLQLMLKDSNNSTVEIEKDAFLTRDAQEYIKAEGIDVVRANHGNEKKVTASGKKKKPEHMTSLNAEEYVVKNNPRIVLRGKLDSFQAKILELQVLAESSGNYVLLDKLEEILDYSRKILIAEVTEKKLEDITLFGFDEEQLRYISQHPKENFGMGHMAPNYRMGGECVFLDSLRTASREVEIAGINAFCTNECIEREDILRALNRLSSGIYILYCETLSQKTGF